MMPRALAAACLTRKASQCCSVVLRVECLRKNDPHRPRPGPRIGTFRACDCPVSVLIRGIIRANPCYFNLAPLLSSRRQIPGAILQPSASTTPGSAGPRSHERGLQVLDRHRQQFVECDRAVRRRSQRRLAPYRVRPICRLAWS
jgi:hypothetical protein